VDGTPAVVPTPASGDATHHGQAASAVVADQAATDAAGTGMIMR
jgi:hypothetical protein